VSLDETTLHAVLSVAAKKSPSFTASVCDWAESVDSHVHHDKVEDLVIPALSILESSARCLKEADAAVGNQVCGSASATGVLGRARAHRLTLCSHDQPGSLSEDRDQDQTAKWMHSGSDTLGNSPDERSGACGASLEATVERDTASDGFHSSTWTQGSAITSSCSIVRSSSSHNSRSSSCAQADQVSDDLVAQNHSLGVSPGGPFQRSHGLVLLLRHEFLKYAFLGNLDFQAWFVLRRLSPAAAATLPCDLVEEVARHTPWALTSRQMHANLLRGANDANQLFIYLMRMGSSAPFKGCFQELFDAVKGRRWTLGSRMIADHSNVGPFSWPDQEVADHSTTTVSRLDQEAQRCIVSAPKEAKRCMNLRDLLLWLFELLWYKLVFDFAAGWLNQVAGMSLLPPIRRLCS